MNTILLYFDNIIYILFDSTLLISLPQTEIKLRTHMHKFCSRSYLELYFANEAALISGEELLYLVLDLRCSVVTWICRRGEGGQTEMRSCSSEACFQQPCLSTERKQQIHPRTSLDLSLAKITYSININC